jgi:initiation factor 1A
MPSKKNAKRHKRASDEKVVELPDLDPFQQYAKVFAPKGELRFDVVTNDGTMVSAHLCGKMRKRQWVQKNDIVVISLRDDLAGELSKTHGHIMKGDICAKVPQELYGKLKKIDGFNLLKTINQKNDGTVILGNGAEGGAGADDDIGYEFVYEGEEDEDDGNESDSSAASHDSAKKERRKKAGQARKEMTEIDIDKI